MKIEFMTHRGAVRPQNQDALQLGDRIWTNLDVPESCKLDTLPLLISVVDGMGGYRGGEEAAEILACTLAEGANCFAEKIDLDEDTRLLNGLLSDACKKMAAVAHERPELAEMGAAVAGLLIRERTTLAFNCGDCRAYRFSMGELEKLTHDHSVVQQLFDNEAISEEEMRSHSRKNIVISAIGAKFSEFELFVKPLSRMKDDAFFLCSDGVWEALSRKELTSCLSDEAPDAPQKLFDALIRAECHDNVSFIWVR